MDRVAVFFLSVLLAVRALLVRLRPRRDSRGEQLQLRNLAVVLLLLAGNMF